MNLDKIKAANSDGSYNVIIEIPMQASPVKYEFDKETGAIAVDRFMQVAMHYPCNYGFVPHSLSDDGDPADVLVMTQYPIMAGATIKVRPVAVLIMEDESGIDEKILAVPTKKIDPFYSNIDDISDIEPIMLERINHFFESYKKLDKNKWVKIQGWEGASKAKEILDKAIVNN